MMYFNAPNFKDKIFCSLMYLGTFIPLFIYYPFIWLIVANLKKIPNKDFVKYHLYQSILFNMIALFLPEIFAKLIDTLIIILSFIPVFENTIFLLEQTKLFSLNAYFILVKLLGLYAIIWTFRGKFTYLPPLSQAVNLLLR